MERSRAVHGITPQFPSRVLTFDSHTAGEPTRLIVKGVGPLPGASVPEKRKYFVENLDPIRLPLTREPRGHRDMVVAEIRGSVHMTGIHQFVIGARDPFAEEFLI